MNNSERFDWCDIAKAIAIFMVVWNHSATGITQFTLPGPIVFITDFFHLFSLSAFFFVAGVVVVRSVKKDFPSFFWRLFSMVYYPMVLWSILQGTLYAFAADHVEEQIPIWEPLLTSWYSPHKQMGFLLSIIIGRLLFYAAYRLNIQWWVTVLLTFGLVVAFALNWHDPFFVPIDPGYLFFMALGVAAATTGLASLIGKFSVFQAFLASAVFFSIALFLDALPGQAKVSYFLITGLRFFAMFGVIFFAIALSKLPWTSWLNYVGQRSLVIFCAHLIITGGTRIFLIKIVGMENPMIIFPICFALGVLLPLLFVRILGRDWTFQLPAHIIARIRGQ